MQVRYGKELDCPGCGVHSKFHRIRKRPVYSCQWCGYQIRPMEGTPLERTHTAIQKWFYAMYLFTTSRHGVPAKELQRQLGVTYKTAWRIGHEIRKHMAKTDGSAPLGGHVEAGETCIGGRVRGETLTLRKFYNKTPIFEMVQRGGHVQAKVVRNRAGRTLEPTIQRSVEFGSTITTETFGSHKDLHLAAYEYVTTNHLAGQHVRTLNHTNTTVAFWSTLKRSIRGAHVHVSCQYLPEYLGEFEYRWKMRHAREMMFARLLTSLELSTRPDNPSSHRRYYSRLWIHAPCRTDPACRSGELLRG